MSSASDSARHWLAEIFKLPAPAQPFHLLNVCGGHERSITQAGLRSVLPEWLKLVPGPGCPVCVCPEEDIALAIAIAVHHPVTLLAFGDLLRVPVNPRRFRGHGPTPLIPVRIRSLAEAKAAGADIRPIASPLDALAIAQQQQKPVVFFAAGFETTMAPMAALIGQYLRQGLPDNLGFLISGRRTWPAVAQLLNDDKSLTIDGLIAPGHVATVMGMEEWRFVVSDHQLPAAVAGFDSDSLLQAFYRVLVQTQTGTPALENCYPQAVTLNGNTRARQQLDECFLVNEANWRGIGVLPASGYQLRSNFDAVNARVRYGQLCDEIQACGRDRDLPNSCQCADVVMARCLPHECRLYGHTCTPQQPVGPCMVSDEGACRIWWSAGVTQLHLHEVHP